MRRFLIVQFFICLFLGVYAQKPSVSISGLQNVNIGETCVYRIDLTGVGKTNMMITCGKYGRFMGTSDTIMSVNFSGSTVVQVIWGGTATSDAYVRAFSPNNPIGLNAKIDVRIIKSPPFELAIQSSSNSSLQYASVKLEAMIDPSYVKSYTWSGSGFIITSGQGTKTVSGHFDRIGNEEVELKVELSRDVYYTKKSFYVFPKYIEGPNLICDKGRFSVGPFPNGIGLNNIEWSTAGGKVEILPGADNSSVELVSIVNKFGKETLSARIKNDVIDYVIKCDLTTGTPEVRSISGLSHAPMHIVEPYGAVPTYSPDEASYTWVVDPAEGASQNVRGSTNFITFRKPGMYTIVCYAYAKNCPNTTLPARMMVSVGGNYSISSKYGIVTITKSRLENMVSMFEIADVSPLVYELYNQGSGMLIKRGTVNNNGGTLDFSGLQSGIYILNLLVNKESKETHKVVIN